MINKLLKLKMHINEVYANYDKILDGKFVYLNRFIN